MNVNDIANTITQGWIARCATLGLGRPRPATATDLLTIALFVASLTIAPTAQARPVASGSRSSGHGLAGTIQHLDRQMDMYERSDLLTLAKECIPLDDLKSKAKAYVESNEVPGFEDGLALALVKWFKAEFFQWVDPIKCPRCGGSTAMRGMGNPNQEERAGGAGRVEIHACSENTGCSGETRFPRYNDPKALMKSRVGRCGEFANLFCLFIRAVGLRARYVWNAEDHVWNEHWSPTLRRWIHLDSCERVRDEPLLYDRGWGKKMSYILAFSVDGAQDVTRGYVQDWKETLKRRKQGSEDVLQEILGIVTVNRRAGRPSTELDRLEEEDCLEEVWLSESQERAKMPTDIDGQGRTAGTEDWVRQRGEDGGSS